MTAVESDWSLREEKFVAFVAKMMELDPRACFADVTRLRSLSREDQPFAAFLVVLVELPETARVLVERLGYWRRMLEVIDRPQDPTAKPPAEFFQQALDGNGEWTRLDFGRGHRGAYRKATHRDQFGEALYQYLLKVKSSGTPLALSTNDWTTALEKVRGIPSFGALARFNYLERLCLLGITTPPDQYLPSGGGPERGFEMIYGTSDNMMSNGTQMLHSLTERTGNPLSLFALETFLCNMQKEKYRHCFLQLFNDPSFEEAVLRAIKCYQDSRR